MIQTARDIIADFLKFYEKRLSPAMVMFYECAIEQFDEDILCHAALNLKMHEQPNRFPTVATIHKYYFEERDARLQRQKASEPGISRLSRLNIPASSDTYEKFRRVFSAIGKMPKDEWLRLAVESEMLKPADVEVMKEAWQRMGADADKWRKSGLLG